MYFLKDHKVALDGGEEEKLFHVLFSYFAQTHFNYDSTLILLGSVEEY